MLYAHILRYGISAPATAAESKGRSHFEVVQVADTALGRGGIDNDAASLHPGRESIQHFRFFLCVCIQGSCVTVATVGNQPLCFAECVFDIPGPVHCQHGAQLLMREFFRQLHRFNFSNEHLGSFRHSDTGQCCDFAGALADDFRVQCAVGQDRMAHLVQVSAFQEPAAPGGKFGPDRFIDTVQHDYALFGSADHTVIKGLGMNDRIDRQDQVGAVVNYCRHVSGTHTQSRFAAGICGLYHAGPTCSQDDICVPHQGVGHLQGGHINPADDAFRSAGLYCRIQYDFRGGNCRFLRPGMRTENNPVAGFQTDQGFENSCGGRVGSGYHRRHHTDGLRDLLYAENLVFLDHAAGFGIPISVINIFTGVVILDYLIFHHTHAGFFHGHSGQWHPGLIGCRCCSQEDPVHLFLRVGGEYPLRRAHPGDSRLQRFHTVHHVKCFGFHTVPPLPVLMPHWLPYGDKPKIMQCLPGVSSHRTAL